MRPSLPGRSRSSVPADTRPPAPLSGTFVFLALVLLLLHAWILRGFLVDDAFISWRYARHLAEGLGPVFNPGERVEGFSNPLYTMLMGVVAWLVGIFGGGRDAVIAHLPGLGRAVGVAAALGTIVAMARWRDVSRAPGTLLAVLLTATSTSLALWSVGGLETTLYGFFLAAAFGATLAQPRTTMGRLGTGLLLAAVALSRPEGIVPAGALFLVRWLDPATRDERRGHLEVGLAFALPVLAWFLFRVTWFGDWLPNTYYAKKLGLAEAWRKGSWYLVSFVHHNGGRWLYAPAVLAFFDRPRRRLAWTAGFVLAAYIPYILFVGGDWMDQHRFLAPVVPFIYLLTGLGWGVLIETGRRLLVLWPGEGRLVDVAVELGVLVAWCLLLRPTYDLTRAQVAGGGYVNARPYYETVGREISVLIGDGGRPGWRGLVWPHEGAPPVGSAATHDIGAIGWYGGVGIVDLLGLVDRDLAKGRVDAEELIARERPDLVVLHYDNRSSDDPSRPRWRELEAHGLDTLYVPVAIHGYDGLPWLRVRSDREAEVRRRWEEVRTRALASSIPSAAERNDGGRRRSDRAPRTRGSERLR
ncbi:MAG TPA: hypothetical protein VF720_06495, partial [Candidatus Eisenbacteria bacterium]